MRMVNGPSRFDARHTVLAFGAVLLLVLWAAVFQQDRRAREASDAGDRQGLMNYARILESHTRSVILGLDQVVMHLKTEFEDDPKRFDLKKQMARSPILKGITVQVGIIDAEGYLLLSSSPIPPGPRIDLRDREHYKVHAREDSGELFISKPVLGRASGKWSIQLARRMNGKNGQFLGVMVVSLDPGYIASIHDQIDLGPKSTILVLGRDGIARVRSSEGDRTVGQSFADVSFFKELWEKPEGFVRGASPVDAIERIGAFRQMADYPLAVIVSRSAEDLAASHQHDHRLLLIAGLSATLLVMAGIALLFWQFGLQHETERRLLAREAELMAARERLERSNEELKNFARIIAHDLQEPLRAIVSYAQLMNMRYKGKLDADADEFISFLVDGASSMKARLIDLLDYTLIDQFSMNLEPVALGEVLDNVRGTLAETIAKTQARIAYADLPSVMATPRRLGLLFEHLLENSLEYRSKDLPPLIQITAKVLADGFVEVSVSDNGIGIEEQYFDRIFVIFQRLHSSAYHSGTGVGLAICKKIVEQLGGRISVESLPGRGTTFRFTLPAVSAHEIDEA
ncbi:MAG: sensor histidine kinase [Rhodospirillales bacterium]|nr:MAG: sensor histidine kinase [Rhodospirillales bacterium]